MHILLIHQAFAALDEPGGTRHHELARFLVQQGHDVTIITSSVSYLTGKVERANQNYPPGRGDVDGYYEAGSKECQLGGKKNALNVLRTYTYPVLHRSFVHRVISFFSFMTSSFWVGLRVENVDLVWGTSPPIFQGVTAFAISRLKRLPFLFEVRDLWPAFAVAVGVLQNPLLIRLSEWLERFLLTRANRVVVNSPGFIDHVTARGARVVELVPNSADPRMFDPHDTGASFRTQLGLQGKLIALYAGAHGLSNDLGILLDVAARLRDRLEIALVLLGDGKEKQNLVSRASEMELDNLYFFPPLPKAQMPEALAAADICIGILKPIPLYATVYPNKIFDYMAAGRPIVLAMEGVIRQVVETAGAGIPVPPGDPEALAAAIRTLADDPERRRTMGYAGRAFVEAHFDRNDIAAHLERLMREMCP